MTSVLVAVVFHSDPEALSECIASILDAGPASRVVVFDTSRAGTARRVADAYGVTWRDGSRNAGYSWALNRVEEEWAGTYEVFVASNSDVRFVDGALARLVSHSQQLHGACYALQKRRDGVVGYYSVQSQMSLLDSVARWIGIGRRRVRELAHSTVQRAAETGAPTLIPAGYAGSGAVVAVPADIWLATGGFDNDYFLFEEDRSFGTRLEELGVSAYLCGDCVVVHDGGFSSRGLTIAGTLECVVSEQIAWRKHKIGPGLVLWAVQLIGLVGRVAVAIARRRSRSRRVYSGVMGDLVWRVRSGGRCLYGADGLRVPATQPQRERV
jgi:N-acetylglucosaminyl-diphospho-decaprenol L-rhamnosyltransferase